MKERLEQIDQIVDDLLNNRAELTEFVNEHLLQAERVEEQQKEIKRLENRVEFRERMSKDAKTEIAHLQNELVKSGEEIERLRRALEFYADKQNYVANVVDQWEPVVPIVEDCGEKAREALEGRK